MLKAFSYCEGRAKEVIGSCLIWLDRDHGQEGSVQEYLAYAIVDVKEENYPILGGNLFWHFGHFG